MGKPRNSTLQTRPARPSGPPGRRCYAIGDVHGELELLVELLARIVEHDRARGPRQTSIVLLGDLIDRGHNSKGVVDLALKGRQSHRLLSLRGNHEDMLLSVLGGQLEILPRWLASGGDACIRSYGLAPGGLLGLPAEEVAARIMTHIPDEHVKYLATLPDSARFGDYFLAHAGVRPGVPLDQQQPSDLRWIRGEFLESDVWHGAVIVHGHSVAETVEVRSNRIGIDTGAYRTGTLTAVCLEEEHHEFLQVQTSKTRHNSSRTGCI